MIICKYGSPTITGILRPGSIKNWLTSNNFLQIAPYKKLQWWYPSTRIASQNSTYFLSDQPSTECPSTCFHIDRATTYLTDFLVGIRLSRCERRWEDDGVDESMEGSSSSSVCCVARVSALNFSFPQWFGCNQPNHEVQRVQPPIWAHQSLMIFSKLQKCSKYQRHEPTGLVRVDPAKELTNKAVMG